MNFLPNLFARKDQQIGRIGKHQGKDDVEKEIARVQPKVAVYNHAEHSIEELAKI